MEGRSIVVTGASSGIGRATALRLAGRGYRVFAGVRKSEDGQALLRDAPSGLSPVILDVTKGESIAAAAAEIGRVTGGALHGLVDNAGITVAGPLELLPIDALRRQFEVNLFGQIAVTQAFLPQLREARGRIVLIGSILGKLSVPFVAPYAATKFALEAVADSLAIELSDSHVAVSLIEAGNIATPIWDKSKGLAFELAESWPEKGWELYRSQLSAFQAYAERAAGTGIGPERVAAVVERALSARRPRSRYAVGWDARLLGRIAPLLPGRLRQRIVRRVVLSGRLLKS